MIGDIKAKTLNRYFKLANRFDLSARTKDDAFLSLRLYSDGSGHLTANEDLGQDDPWYTDFWGDEQLNNSLTLIEQKMNK